MAQDVIKKVDEAMARVQELQSTIWGGSKCKNLSPRSLNGYRRASLKCKELSMRLQQAEQAGEGARVRRSKSLGREWRRWSLPGALLQEAVVEIVEASNGLHTVTPAHYCHEKANVYGNSARISSPPSTKKRAFFERSQSISRFIEAESRGGHVAMWKNIKKWVSKHVRH